MIAGLLTSNMLLKKQYDQIDKTDHYWAYDKVLEQPFRHLNIRGGNITHIFYEPSKKNSVRLLHEWAKYHGGNIQADVKNDTLFINFNFKPVNAFEKVWLENAVPVRIFSPELLSVTAHNTNFEMQKLKQKGITANISGKSKFEIESLFPEMDSVNITQTDSTAVIFEMSPDYRKSSTESETPGKVQIHHGLGESEVFPPKPTDFDEIMSIRSVTANIKGYSIFDIGHAQIKNLSIQVADSSAIVLSGTALKLSKQ